jgi:hypothetical protein
VQSSGRYCIGLHRVESIQNTLPIAARSRRFAYLGLQPICSGLEAERSLSFGYSLVSDFDEKLVEWQQGSVGRLFPGHSNAEEDMYL